MHQRTSIYFLDIIVCSDVQISKVRCIVMNSHIRNIRWTRLYILVHPHLGSGPGIPLWDPENFLLFFFLHQTSSFIELTCSWLIMRWYSSILVLKNWVFNPSLMRALPTARKGGRRKDILPLFIMFVFPTLSFFFLFSLSIWVAIYAGPLNLRSIFVYHINLLAYQNSACVSFVILSTSNIISTIFCIPWKIMT